MYKGKYEQNQTPAAPEAARIPSSGENRPAPETRREPRREPQRRPAQRSDSQGEPRHNPQRDPQRDPQRNPQRRPQQRKRKGAITKGTYIFYGVYLAIILVFFIGIAIGMGALKDWLMTYQAAQPETKSQQVFQQLFAQPDWSDLYTTANPDADAKVAAAYEKFMTELVGNDQLTYVETTAGLSGDKKYIVCHGNTGIATFTLTADNKDDEIPDWQLGNVTVFFSYKAPNLCYSIFATPGCTVTVNGDVLGEDNIIRKITTKAEEYLPNGVHGYRLLEYRVTGLEEAPEVVITDADGAQVDATFDEAAKTYSQVLPEAPVISSDSAEYKAVLGAAKAWTEYMIKGGTAGLKQYYDTSSEAYKNIVSGEIFRQSYSSYSFNPEEITEYYRYSDTLFSAKIKLVTVVIRKADGYHKEFTVDCTYIFKKTGGKWIVYDQVNTDIQEQITEVRVTYKDSEGNILSSDFVNADAKFMTAPTVQIPEGKVFGGWYEETTDERGNVTLSLKYKPDANGSINLAGSEDALESMILVSVFEDTKEEG